MARALATARANIIRLDPKRLASIRALAPTREQELAARLRQERVARTLGDARATVAMLAELQTPSRRPTRSKIVHTKNDERRPEAPRCVEQGAPQGEATNYYDVERKSIAICPLRCSIKSTTSIRKNSMPSSARTIACQRELDVHPPRTRRCPPRACRPSGGARRYANA